MSDSYRIPVRVPGRSYDSVFAERESYNAFVGASIAAFEAEAANLRAQFKSERWIEAWLGAASGSFAAWLRGNYTKCSESNW